MKGIKINESNTFTFKQRFRDKLNFPLSGILDELALSFYDTKEIQYISEMRFVIVLHGHIIPILFSLFSPVNDIW